MSDESKRVKSGMMRKGLLFLVSYFILHSSAFPQQPQAPAGTPLYSVNAKYVNGMAPGYWATAGSGLTLSLSAGTAYCGNPPAPVSYPGGSLTLSASATNYIYLDPANNCAPTAGTSAFTAGEIPIAKVVTGASSITSITDARTWFAPQPCVAGSAGDINCSSMGTNQDITLTPSGTGASVVTNLEDKGGQVFNVRAYGAVGNGVTNDSPAFQAAYNAAVAARGGVVYVPPSTGCYLLSTAINMTEDSTVVRIEGSGGANATSSGSGGAICANTGGVLFDLTASTNKKLEDLSVTAQTGVTNPSTIGILLARDSTNKSGQNNYVIGCKFAMPLHTSGTTYSFGAYLYGSEITFMERDVFVADYPLVVSDANSFSVSSPFQTLGTSSTQSETDTTFRDMELQTSGLGPAVFIHGASDLILTGHSWNFNAGNPYSSSLYGYAIEIYASQQLHIKWRQEGFPGFASITLGTSGSEIEGSHAPAGSPPTHAIEFLDASSELKNDVFNIRDEYSSASTNWYYDSSDAATTGVAIVDNVDFACGGETNCVNLPIGNYTTGGALYWHDVRWSGGSNNQYPIIKLNGPLTGTFSIPATAVAANTCSSLTSVTAGTSASSFLEIGPQNWYNLIITGSVVNGSFTPKLCNTTNSSITPAATTAHWTVKQ